MTFDAKSDDEDTYFCDLCPTQHHQQAVSSYLRDHLANFLVLAITWVYSGPSF